MEQVLRGYEADIAKLQGKLREARARQNAISARFESAVTRAKAREMMHGSRTAEAFSKFEVLERRADFAEGRSEALGIGSLEDEIEQLRASQAVDRELEEMKAALKARAAVREAKGHDPQDLPLFARPPRREDRRGLLDARQAYRDRPDVHSRRLRRRAAADSGQLQSGARRLCRAWRIPRRSRRSGEVENRGRMSEFDRMDEVVSASRRVHAMRTELDVNDRRLMAIDHHLNSQNDELAREIEALRQEDK